MPRIQPTRKARFKAACALAGITQGQWAESQDVDPSHVHKVLRDERESLRLTAAIEEFITVTMQKHAGRAA